MNNFYSLVRTVLLNKLYFQRIVFKILKLVYGNFPDDFGVKSWKLKIHMVYLKRKVGTCVKNIVNIMENGFRGVSGS